jgi:hypothetical protein
LTVTTTRLPPTSAYNTKKKKKKNPDSLAERKKNNNNTAKQPQPKVPVKWGKLGHATADRFAMRRQSLFPCLQVGGKHSNNNNTIARKQSSCREDDLGGGKTSPLLPKSNSLHRKKEKWEDGER